MATLSPPPAVVISATGIFCPAFEDLLDWLTSSYQAIYGSDAYLAADSQDGQMIAVFATAWNAANQALVTAYNSFSPATAQGAGLSSVIKINGMRRQVPSNSTATLTLTGQAGKAVAAGAVVQDLLGNQWVLPAFTIPVGGSVQATAVCSTKGAIAAAPNTITTILTNVPGWQSATNALSAVAGAPVESDAAVRRRQAISTALPASAILTGIAGAVAEVAGVTLVQPYETPSNVVDVNGLPPHNIALVVEGGDAVAVAQAIALKKPPGIPTQGNVTETVVDSKGVPSTVNFYQLVEVPLTVVINLKALVGYTAGTQDVLTDNLIDYVGTLPVGFDSYLTKLYTAMTTGNQVVDHTFDVISIQQSRTGVPVASDVSIAFNEGATLDASGVSFVVST